MGTMQELGIGDMGIDLAGIGQGFGDFFMYFVWALAIGGIIAGLGFWYYRYTQYKYLVFLNEPRGSTLMRSATAGREVTLKDGTKRLYIQKLGRRTAMPEPELISPSTDKRLNRGVIELLIIDHETITPIHVSRNVAESIADYGIRLIPLANRLNDIRELNNDLKETYMSSNWLKNNAGMLVQLAGLTLIIGGMIMIVVLMQDIATAISNGSSSLASASNTLTTAIETMDKCRVGGI